MLVSYRGEREQHAIHFYLPVPGSEESDGLSLRKNIFVPSEISFKLLLAAVEFQLQRCQAEMKGK